MRALLLCLVVAGCSRGELSDARATYNNGLADLGERAWESAADKLLAARDEAGPDPELRYRAAFNLGIAHAGRAEQLEPSDPKAALAALGDAASWFRDAVRLRPDERDARVNLERVLHRRRVLADRINQEAGGLEARLDRLIEDQRQARDAIRQLLGRAQAEGIASDPQPLAAEFDGVAVSERVLASETGIVIDLVAGERSVIEQTPEDQRQPESAARLYQLGELESYLVSARGAVADSRRLLRRLEGERAHRRADAALRDLKRARETLAQPIAVLRSIAQDQQILAMHTDALRQLASGTLKLGADDDAPAAAPPPWLNAEHLAERQLSLAERTSAVHAGLTALAGARDQLTAEQAAQMSREIEVAAQAAPFVAEAAAAMGRARSSLIADQLEQSTAEQQAALAALAQAIERFADLRPLIELAYATQNQLVQLLTPPPADTDPSSLPSTEEVARALTEGSSQNRDRLQRMQQLIADQLAQVEAQAAQAAQAGAAQGAAAPPPDAAQAVEAEKQKLARAEELRAAALAEVDALATLLAARRMRADAALAAAKTGLSQLEELRKLFFSIIEHLQQLHRDQSETRDQSATAHEQDDDARALALGPIDARQSEHADLGEALASALETQADQMAGAPADDPQAAEQAQRLAEAAPEVRSAATAMRNADGLTGKAVEQAGQMSIDFEPILEEQKAAIEHLENALRILQPPKPNEQDQQDQDQQKDQNQGDQQQDDMSQSEAQRRLRAIREREAERRRQQEKGRAAADQSVEKDW